MTTIIEIRPQVWAVRINGHQLRQHYFTRQSALQAMKGAR